MIRKLLAIDLDGTAVGDNGKIGSLTKQALAEARQEGHIVCFVTGRRDIDMLPLGQDYRCADYLILNNGGKITSTFDGEVLENDLVDKEDTRRLIAYCLQRDYSLHIFSGMYWAINKMTPATLEYSKELGIIPEYYRGVDEVLCERIEGFTTNSEGKDIGAFIDVAGMNLTYIDSQPTYIDIMKKGISKWRGVQSLADKLNIPVANTVAVGNYSNDIDMLVNAGVGVAVQNALPSVKAAADYVILKDNNHDPVAEIVEKFILSRKNLTVG